MANYLDFTPISRQSKAIMGDEYDKKAPTTEVTTDPEYADLILSDITLHGNEQRNPKEWHSELTYNAKRHQDARIYANNPDIAVYPVQGTGMIIEQRFPLGPEALTRYNQALASGRGFKIYAPKDGIKILFHESLKERIRAHNRKVGYEEFDLRDGRGRLCSFDVVDGVAIIKVLIQ